MSYFSLVGILAVRNLLYPIFFGKLSAIPPSKVAGSTSCNKPEGKIPDFLYIDS